MRKKLAAARPRGSRRAALPAAGRPPGGRLPTSRATGYHRHVEALEVSAGRAAAAPRARDGAGRVLGSRAEPLTGKALPKSDAAPSAPAGPAITAAADAMQRAREDRDRLIRDLKRR
ncbi:hypothetical protein MSG28_004035 [Choristoneura fumiferana]|uniref:Uncharacterized protein n=1 Tax=Choristoneura fumiferana TaxID=7141 RepID=A0ACC0KH71_CHOFU|nr:hypothetical protein MSG28_004035 [Choristoneura fumiferana]